MKLIDINGFENECLKVIKRVSNKVYDNGSCVTRWQCKCKSCGKFFYTSTRNITSGKTKSCGCITGKLRGEGHKTHGMTGTRIYRIWAHMISRCKNKNVPEYRNYGARGICVCEEWENDFSLFYQWAIENGYSENLTIDRIDNNGNYCPENCRWVDIKTQCRNRRVTVKCEVDGVIKPLAEWCELYGADYYLVHQRIRYQGMPPKDALTLNPYERK